MSAKIIQFPRKPLPPENSPRWSDGTTQDRCEGLIHVFAEVPGRCQCGEEYWDDDNLPGGVGIHTDSTGCKNWLA